LKYRRKIKKVAISIQKASLRGGKKRLADHYEKKARRSPARCWPGVSRRDGWQGLGNKRGFGGGRRIGWLKEWDGDDADGYGCNTRVLAEPSRWKRGQGGAGLLLRSGIAASTSGGRCKVSRATFDEDSRSGSARIGNSNPAGTVEGRFRRARGGPGSTGRRPKVPRGIERPFPKGTPYCCIGSYCSFGVSMGNKVFRSPVVWASAVF